MKARKTTSRDSVWMSSNIRRAAEALLPESASISLPSSMA